MNITKEPTLDLAHQGLVVGQANFVPYHTDNDFTEIYKRIAKDIAESNEDDTVIKVKFDNLNKEEAEIKINKLIEATKNLS